MHKISILFFISIFGWLTSCTQEKSDVTHSKTAINPHYLDPYRPQIHYSCDTGWLSDPNGLFYQDWVWHLMFQETSNRHGMNTFTNWGHAASTNLLHWDHLPVALEVGNRIRFYSGSVYVDNLNASGLGKDGQILVLAYYTTHPTKYK